MKLLPCCLPRLCLAGESFFLHSFRRGAALVATSCLHMTLEELLKDKRETILRIAANYGARNVRVFGSAARGEAGKDSDLDFLVDFEQGRSLLDQAGMILDLEALLGRKVDVVTENGLYWLLRRRILKEARPL